jgi:hypothetical protein
MREKHPRVFVSYSRDDAAAVNLLLKELQRTGVEYWSDAALSAGQDWAEETDSAIRESTIIVLVVSPNYLRSNWSMLEAGAALARAREGSAVIVPVILQPVDMPRIFSHFEAIDARKLAPSEVADRIRDVAQSAA